MFNNLWWVYVSLGIILIIMEIFTPGFIVMWFGISFIIVAIPVYFHASTQIVLLTFTVTVLFLTIFVRNITINLFSKSSAEIKTNISSIIGAVGVVVEEINTIASTGRVRIRKEVWTAVSENTEVIEENAMIRVLRIEGVKLIVKKEIKQ